MIAVGRYRAPAILAAKLVPCAAAAVAFVWVLNREHRDNLAPSSIWGLVLLASYVGWGRILLQWLYPGRKTGWGLDGTVGMAITIAFGGMTMLLHVAHAPLVLMWVACGIGALGVAQFLTPVPHAWWTTLRGVRRSSHAWPIWLFQFLFAIVLGVRFVGAAANATFNKWDDNMAYRGFARQILDTGTLIEPFSYHRVGSYCGQSFLHAMVLAVSGPSRVHIIDDGIALLLIAGLALGYEVPKRRVARIASLIVLTLVVTLPHEPHNIQAALSAVAFFLAFFRLMDATSFANASPKSNAMVVGLLAAGVCTLRQNYMSTAAAIVFFYYVSAVFGDRGRWRRWVLEALAIGVVVFALLIPWAVLSYASAHTFLYPIMRGTTNPDFGILGTTTKVEEINWAITNTGYLWPVRGVPLLLLAAVLMPHRANTRAIHAMLLGTIVGFVTLIHFFQAFDQAESLARYYLAFGVAFAFAMTLKASSEHLSRHVKTGAYALAAAALVVQVIDVRDKTVGLYNKAVTNISQDAERLATERDRDPKEDFYRRMQGVIPRGARTIIMVDETYRWDGERNPLWNFDQPGAMSPAPGVPYFQGAEAFARYFKSLGVRYLAFVVSETSPEYQYNVWRQRLGEIEKKNGRGNMYRVQARYYINTLDTFTELAHRFKVLFHEEDNWVLDLETRAP